MMWIYLIYISIAKYAEQWKLWSYEKYILLILARAAQHFHSAVRNLFVAKGVTEIAFPAGLSKASITQHQDLFMIFLVKS